VSKPVKRNGRIEMEEVLISNKDINADWVTASATIVGTHKIMGVPYVDGGYTNNPPYPRAAQQKKYTDLVAVQLSDEPKGPLIPSLQSAHINHETFLYYEPWRELALICQQGALHVHVVGMKAEPHWDHTSKMNFEPRFIDNLEQLGLVDSVELADDLEKNLGIRSSYNPQISAASHELALDNIA
jgi:predicted acylesterase/phospholipase RssA